MFLGGENLRPLLVISKQLLPLVMLSVEMIMLIAFSHLLPLVMLIVSDPALMNRRLIFRALILSAMLLLIPQNARSALCIASGAGRQLMH